MSQQTARQRWQYHGTVQGVGFRASVSQLSHRHSVTGFVRNNPDGSVTVEVQGSELMLHAFRQEIDKELGFRIDEVTVTKLEPQIASDEGVGETKKRFEIRY